MTKQKTPPLGLAGFTGCAIGLIGGGMAVQIARIGQQLEEDRAFALSVVGCVVPREDARRWLDDVAAAHPGMSCRDIGHLVGMGGAETLSTTRGLNFASASLIVQQAHRGLISEHQSIQLSAGYDLEPTDERAVERLAARFAHHRDPQRTAEAIARFRAGASRGRVVARALDHALAVMAEARERT